MKEFFQSVIGEPRVRNDRKYEIFKVQVIYGWIIEVIYGRII